MRVGILLASLGFLAACDDPKGACILPAIPDLVPFERCRNDVEQTCVQREVDPGPPKFVPKKKCVDLGFECVGDGLHAAAFKALPDGTCPEGSWKPNIKR